MTWNMDQADSDNDGVGNECEIASDDGCSGDSTLIQGQIVSIVQCNRTSRLLIGLGSGKSSISADAQLYALSATTPPRFMTAFEGEADSGTAPESARLIKVS